MKKHFYLIIIMSQIFWQGSADSQNISYKPGDGIHLSSDKNSWDLFLSGYIQSIFSYHTVSSDVNNSFGVHRARLDLGFDYLQKYDMFFELETAGQRTEMVLAQVDAKLWEDNTIRAGKFINPFSPENNRSTSRLTTIERYSGLNSVFILPALDAQFGIMFFGTSSLFDYYLSVTNGNGAAAQNIPENNNAKDFTTHIDFKASGSISLGGSLEYTTEASQTLSLVDHLFQSFNSVSVSGKRLGYLADFSFNKNPFLLRGEGFVYHFNKSLSPENQVGSFTGAYLEAGYFITGSSINGLQAVLRYETARYGKKVYNITGPQFLNSYLLGINWLSDNIFSFQVNLIFEDADKASVIPKSVLFGKNKETVLLTTFQLRF